MKNGFVEGNIVHECLGIGIGLDGCEGVAVRGNHLTRNMEGIWIQASNPDSPGGDLLIQGNVVRLNEGSSISLPYLPGRAYPHIVLDGNLLSDEEGNPVEANLPSSVSAPPAPKRTRQGGCTTSLGHQAGGYQEDKQSATWMRGTL